MVEKPLMAEKVKSKQIESEGELCGLLNLESNIQIQGCRASSTIWIVLLCRSVFALQNPKQIAEICMNFLKTKEDHGGRA